MGLEARTWLEGGTRERGEVVTVLLLAWSFGCRGQRVGSLALQNILKFFCAAFSSRSLSLSISPSLITPSPALFSLLLSFTLVAVAHNHSVLCFCLFLPHFHLVCIMF